MKKFTIHFIITLLVFQAVNLFSQTGKSFLIYENFSGLTGLPEGWSVMGLGQDNWSISNTNIAGDLAPELHLHYSPTFDGIPRLVTSAVNTEGLTEIPLTFRHQLLLYGIGPESIKVETTSDGGTTWNLVWEYPLTDAIDAEIRTLNITTSDVGSANFQIAFTFDGNVYNLWDWKIDDISLGSNPDMDVAATLIGIDELIQTGNTVTPHGTVKNTGTEEISSFDVTFEIVQGETTMYSEIVQVADLANNETAIVAFPDWTSIEGEYEASITTNLSGDENTDNDEIGKLVKVLNRITFLKPLFQEFTSSTCFPCVSANVVFDSVLANNDLGKFSVIKYQTAFPGDGDPYTTQDVADRVEYYGIDAVPYLIAGTDYSHPYYFTQQLFDSYLMDTTSMTIDINTAIISDADQIAVKATLEFTANYNAGLIAHIAVVEKLTTGNVGTNGETEFTNVLMKMLPNAEGNVLEALSPGNSVILEQTYNMNTTFMEESNDLAVVVFVQNNSSKEIIQSDMVDVTVISRIENTSQIQKNIQVYPNPAFNCLSIKSVSNIETVSIFDMLGRLIETTEETNINTSSFENGLYVFRIKTEEGNIIVKRVEIAH